MAIIEGLTLWAQRNIIRTENDRKTLDGVDTIETFEWLHLPYGDAVEVKNLSKGYQIQAYCNKHNVSSKIEATQGQ